MTVTTYEIMLKTETKSKAKILGKRVKSYFVGRKFEVAFELTNIGSTVFPGGFFSILIEWPNGQIVQKTYEMPALSPKESHKTPPFTTGALSRGFALFSFSHYYSKDGKDLKFLDPSGATVFHEASFYSVLAKEPEEMYEFWGMIIAALSLAFLAGIELVRFLMWLGTILN